MSILNHTRELSEREHVVLRAIIQLFVLHATPVGSRVVSRYLEREYGWSAATIRNVMADLEDLGFIMHPHTSAGRMPTDKGYRMYVDAMLEPDKTSEVQSALAVTDLLSRPKEHLFRDATKVLGSLSRYLAVVRIPVLKDVVVERVEMFALSSARVVVVIALASDIVRTVTLETNIIPEFNTLEEVCRLVNERLSGKPLNNLISAFPEIHSAADERSSLIRLFVDEVGKLESSTSSVHVAGAQNLLQHPEFDNPSKLRSVIELVENEDVIVHLLDNPSVGAVQVRIGDELQNEDLRDYSMIATTYRIGLATGSVGLIGPKRMDYGKMINLVQVVSSVLNTRLDSPIS